ncbi:MAG: metalloprotease [Pirellulales bacterium]
MLIGEPPENQYDLRFSLLGIPVRIHPFFWLVSVLMGWSRDPKLVLIWVASVFVSILVHEMGHALVIRYYGWSPRVTLYSFGGLASYSPGYGSSFSSYKRNGNTTLGQIAISFAGPAAGFLLAGIIYGLLVLTNYQFSFFIFQWLIETPGTKLITNPYLFYFLSFMFYINIYWGIMNLVPVYPLDGGKISREICVAMNIREGLRISLIISLLAAGCVALFAFKMERTFVGIMFAMFAYSSYQQLSGGNNSYGGGRPW